MRRHTVIRNMIFIRTNDSIYNFTTNKTESQYMTQIIGRTAKNLQVKIFVKVQKKVIFF